MKKWVKPVTAAEDVQKTVKDVFRNLIKGKRGNIDEAIKLTPECLSAMETGDKLVVTDIREIEHTGEYTEWSFVKSAHGNFICTRRERVYTGSGRTGYEIQVFGEGIWPVSKVINHVQYNPATVTKYSVFTRGAYDTTTFFTRD